MKLNRPKLTSVCQYLKVQKPHRPNFISFNGVEGASLNTTPHPPSLRASRSDMYDISKAPLVQALPHFTCYQGHCNDWHLRDEVPTGDSIRTGYMNINVVLSGSAALGWTEAPLTGLERETKSACHFIMQQNVPRGIRTLYETLRTA